MKTRLLKAAKAHELFKNIHDNLNRYRSGNFEFIKDDPSGYIELNHDIDEVALSSIKFKDDDYIEEVNNCMAIFRAMGDISHYLARDERLWVYLTHVELLDYARSKWPIPEDDEEAVKHIRTHFHVAGARGFERDNAASRLWWMASLCGRVKELSLEDALKCFLFRTDVRANIVERPTTSQSVNVFSVVVEKLHESFNGDKKLFANREAFRSVMKELNLQGGVKLLASMNKADVDSIFENCVNIYIK